MTSHLLGERGHDRDFKGQKISVLHSDCLLLESPFNAYSCFTSYVGGSSGHMHLQVDCMHETIVLLMQWSHALCGPLCLCLSVLTMVF